MLGRAADVVEDSRDVAAPLVDGILDDAPNAVRARHWKLPVLTDVFELGQVDQDSVQDCLFAAVGGNGGTEYALDFALHFDFASRRVPVRSGLDRCSRYADWRFFRHGPKSSAAGVPRPGHAVPQRGGNAGHRT